MFRLAASVLALSFAVHATAADTKNAVLEMTAVGEVQIGLDGSVSDYQLQNKMPPALASLVDRGVRAWHFEPVIVDGKPVIAKTALRLSLNCVPIDGDNYRVEVSNVIFGSPKITSHMKPPKYPMAAIRSRVGAKVLVYVKTDEAGNVVDVAPYQTSLDTRASSEVEAEMFRKMFEKACLDSARDWHFDVTETLNNRKVGSIAMVPFVFSLNGAGDNHEMRNGEWRVFLPGPIHDSPLGREAKVSNGTSFADLGEGQAQSLNSRFKLRDDVIGKPL